MEEIFDDALLRFVQRVQWNGKPLSVVFASPDRAFGAMRERIARDKKIKPELVAIEHVPLPFINIFRGDLLPNAQLFHPGSVRGIQQDNDSGDVYSSKVPYAFTSTVQMDFWAKTRTEMSNVITQFTLGFPSDEVRLMIDWRADRWYRGVNRQFSYAKWLGVQSTRLKNNGITDTSELEAGEGPRYIRKTFSGELFGVLPYPLVLGRVAKQVQVQTFLEGEVNPDDDFIVP